MHVELYRLIIIAHTGTQRYFLKNQEGCCFLFPMICTVLSSGRESFAGLKQQSISDSTFESSDKTSPWKVIPLISLVFESQKSATPSICQTLLDNFFKAIKSKQYKNEG